MPDNDKKTEKKAEKKGQENTEKTREVSEDHMQYGPTPPAKPSTAEGIKISYEGSKLEKVANFWPVRALATVASLPFKLLKKIFYGGEDRNALEHMRFNRPGYDPSEDRTHDKRSMLKKMQDKMAGKTFERFSMPDLSPYIESGVAKAVEGKKADFKTKLDQVTKDFEDKTTALNKTPAKLEANLSSKLVMQHFKDKNITNPTDAEKADAQKEAKAAAKSIADNVEPVLADTLQKLKDQRNTAVQQDNAQNDKLSAEYDQKLKGLEKYKPEIAHHIAHTTIKDWEKAALEREDNRYKAELKQLESLDKQVKTLDSPPSVVPPALNVKDTPVDHVNESKALAKNIYDEYKKSAEEHHKQKEEGLKKHYKEMMDMTTEAMNQASFLANKLRLAQEMGLKVPELKAKNAPDVMLTANAAGVVESGRVDVAQFNKELKELKIEGKLGHVLPTGEMVDFKQGGRAHCHTTPMSDHAARTLLRYATLGQKGEPKTVKIHGNNTNKFILYAQAKAMGLEVTNRDELLDPKHFGGWMRSSREFLKQLSDVDAYTGMLHQRKETIKTYDYKLHTLKQNDEKYDKAKTDFKAPDGKLDKALNELDKAANDSANAKSPGYTPPGAKGTSDPALVQKLNAAQKQASDDLKNLMQQRRELIKQLQTEIKTVAELKLPKAHQVDENIKAADMRREMFRMGSKQGQDGLAPMDPRERNEIYQEKRTRVGYLETKIRMLEVQLNNADADIQARIERLPHAPVGAVHTPRADLLAELKNEDKNAAAEAKQNKEDPATLGELRKNYNDLRTQFAKDQELVEKQDVVPTRSGPSLGG